MSRKQFAIVVLTVGVCSVLGGAITSHVLAPRPASALIDIPNKVPDVIKARQFMVVDVQDKMRATLTDTGLRVLDADNKLRAKVTADGVGVYSAAGKVRFSAP